MANNWELNHVGIVVLSKNRTLHHFQSPGIGISVGPQPCCLTSKGSRPF